MKIIAWNCRGLASARAVRALLDIQKRERPYVLFLSETHLGKTKAKNLRQRLGFDHFIIHESVGRSGGLLMFWSNDTTIQELGVTENCIDVMINDGQDWRFTGIYGEPTWEYKHKTWAALHALHQRMTGPWLVAGDFNEILYNHEKEGGRPRGQRQMQDFHEALSNCHLSDMGYEGDIFTWQRGRIRERLDRGVSNADWNILFPDATLKNGEMMKSDHRPVIVETRPGDIGRVHRSAGPKHFEARWLKEETMEEIIKTAWERAGARGEGPTFMQKTRFVHEELHTWDRKVLKGPVKQMKKLKRELERLRRGPLSEESIARQKEILIRLELLME